MARKKAKNLDKHQLKCEDEAREIIKNWFETQDYTIDKKDLHVVWFAYIQCGFKCMITSVVHDNVFFEITVNKHNGEIRCDCFKRFEYFVKPATSSKLDRYFSPLPLKNVDARNSTLL